MIKDTGPKGRGRRRKRKRSRWSRDASCCRHVSMIKRTSRSCESSSEDITWCHQSFAPNSSQQSTMIAYIEYSSQKMTADIDPTEALNPRTNTMMYSDTRPVRQCWYYYPYPQSSRRRVHVSKVVGANNPKTPPCPDRPSQHRKGPACCCCYYYQKWVSRYDGIENSGCAERCTRRGAVKHSRRAHSIRCSRRG